MPKRSATAAARKREPLSRSNLAVIMLSVGAFIGFLAGYYGAGYSIYGGRIPRTPSSSADVAASNADDMAVTFTDVTEEVGLRHYHKTPYFQRNCGEGSDIWSARDCEVQGMIAKWMTGAVAVGDYDGDGDPDLYFPHGSELGLLYRNDNGVFTDVTREAGVNAAALGLQDVSGNGAAWVDIDNDDDLDLYVSGMMTDRNFLFVNEGGVFSEQAEIRGGALADGRRHFGYGVAVGDFDRDGWVDLHLTEWRPWFDGSHSRLLRNLGEEGPGVFDDVTDKVGLVKERYDFRFPPDMMSKQLMRDPAMRLSHAQMGFASSFTDLDGDGWQDLVVASDFGSSRMFWNDAGVFTDGTAAALVAQEVNSMGSTLGDYDNDGDLDWFVTAIYELEDIDARGYDGNRFYRNDGARRFTDVSSLIGVREGRAGGSWGWGSAMFDLDNDGDLDLSMTNGFEDHPFATDPTIVWMNDGSRMHDVTASVGIDDTSQGRGMVVLDFDSDGDLDLLIVRADERPILYRNDGGNTGDWLRIAVRGGGGTNIEGLGAKVTVHGPTGRQYREIGSMTHFIGQSERIAHFGLGPDAGPVPKIEIEWPASGVTKVLTEVPPNSTIIIDELGGTRIRTSER